MVQSRGGAGLSTEAFERLRILRHFFRQEFEGNEAAEHGVLGLVNHPHSPAAQFFDDAVMRDSLAQQARKASPFGAHVICRTRASQRLSEWEEVFKRLRRSSDPVSDSIRQKCRP